MKTIGIREAKAKLSKLLRDVRRGQEWVITERGTPVARLSPIEPERESLRQWVQRMEREGLMEPPPPNARIPRPIPIEPPGIAQRILQEDRDASP